MLQSSCTPFCQVIKMLRTYLPKKTFYGHHLALKFTLTALKVLRLLKHSILNPFNFTFCIFIV